MKLTADFWLREFTVSADHPELVEPVPDDFGPNVVRLAVFGLQPTRDHIQRPMRLLSGYRSAALNTAAGGGPTSQHLRAEAADWTCTDVLNAFRALLAGVVRLQPGHLGQVIYYPDSHFVHMALASARYPRPTFCLHWPKRGVRYLPLRDVAHLRAMLDGLT